jgi:hyperosmotically inducible protein
MKLRTLAAVAAVAALAGLAGCDRADQDRVSSARAPATQPQSAPATPTPPAADRTAGQTIDDAGITAKVKAALLAEQGVDGMRINVDTSQGNVTLTGKVPDQTQVERATQVARGIEGVKGVENRLTVGAS